MDWDRKAFLIAVGLLGACPDTSAEGIVKGHIYLNEMHGKPIPDVQISASRVNTISKKPSGTYRLEFRNHQLGPGDDVTLSVVHSEYVVVNRGALLARIGKETSRDIEIVMCIPEKRSYWLERIREYAFSKGVRIQYERFHHGHLSASGEASWYERHTNREPDHVADMTQALRLLHGHEPNDPVVAIELLQFQEQALAQTADMAEFVAGFDGRPGTPMTSEALRQIDRGDLTGALEGLDESVIDEKIAEGEEDLRLWIDTKLLRASLLVSQLEFLEAERVYRQALSLDEEYFESQFALAVFLLHKPVALSFRGGEPWGRHEWTRLTEPEARLRICVDLATTPRQRGNVLTKMGTLQILESDLRGAETSLEEATAIFRGLAENDPVRYLPKVAGTLQQLERVSLEIGMSENAVRSRKEALEVWRLMAAESPAQFLSEVESRLRRDFRFDQAGQSSNLQRDILDAVEIAAEVKDQSPDMEVDLAQTFLQVYMSHPRPWSWERNPGQEFLLGQITGLLRRNPDHEQSKEVLPLLEEAFEIPESPE